MKGKDDILHLCEALELPEFYTGHQGFVFTWIEALMVMLRRLAYPNRLCDLVDIFGRAEPELSIVFNMVTLRHVNCHVFMSHKLISFTLIVYKGCIHACMYFYKNTA